MILYKKEPYYAEGAHGIVFFDNGYAIKIFKRRSDTDYEYVKSVFSSEVDAYQMAMKSDLLKSVVPEFFGVVDCEKIVILDCNEENISQKFYLEFSFKMEKIDGEFVKERLKDESIRNEFCKNGIKFLDDVSILYEGERVKCIVDFATREYELMWSDSKTFQLFS